MVWYSHLLKNFPKFVVIHTVNVSSIVKEAEGGPFLEFPCFHYDPMDDGNLILVPLPFLIQLVHLEILSSCTAEA